MLKNFYQKLVYKKLSLNRTQLYSGKFLLPETFKLPNFGHVHRWKFLVQVS